MARLLLFAHQLSFLVAQLGSTGKEFEQHGISLRKDSSSTVHPGMNFGYLLIIIFRIFSGHQQLQQSLVSNVVQTIDK